MTTKQYQLKCKCLLLGDSGVGKSSLMAKYVDNSFYNHFISTIGVDFKFKKFTVNDKNINLLIWDTAGQERFKSLTTNYYHDAYAVIICFDITDLHTFRNLNFWFSELDKFANPTIKKILCGTKADLTEKRQVKYSDALDFARDKNLDYIEISAKNDNNVDQIFDNIIGKFIESYDNNEIIETKLQLDDPQKILCCY
jgi:small GTP-binding protein